MKKFHSRLLCLLSALCLSLSGLDGSSHSAFRRPFPEMLLTAHAAPSWPESAGIQADGGILVDVDSGAVLYEKNADQAYYPASITKILTALIVIENCDLEDIVTFSNRAVNDVESGSSSMGAQEGDRLSVRDCLYGLMLASANEAANALAEHCAGSIEGFVDMMNQKALELGCTGSHFANPSGLNNENHYTTARDMAIITKAAIANPTFLEIDGSLYWKHGPIKHYPDPDDPHNTVYAHHSMLKKNDSRYYSGAFAGKTGYTSLAGNTLVTCAKRNDMTLICVILNGHQTHYQDTKTLFDYGFQNFRTVRVSDYDHSYTSIENDMTIAGLTASPISTLSLDKDCFITLPQNADFNDVETGLNYQLMDTAPEGSIAQISYRYGGRNVGSSYLKIKDTRSSLAQMEDAAARLSAAETVGIPEPTTKSMDTEAMEAEQSDAPDSISNDALTAPEAEGQIDEANQSPEDPLTGRSRISGSEPSSANSNVLSDSPDAPAKQPSPFRLHISAKVWISLAVTLLLAAVITAIVLLKLHLQRKEEAERYLRKERRKKRLQDIGFSQSEFDTIVEERKRSSYRAPKQKRRKNKTET